MMENNEPKVIITLSEYNELIVLKGKPYKHFATINAGMWTTWFIQSQEQLNKKLLDTVDSLGKENQRLAAKMELISQKWWYILFAKK